MGANNKVMKAYKTSKADGYPIRLGKARWGDLGPRYNRCQENVPSHIGDVVIYLSKLYIIAKKIDFHHAWAYQLKEAGNYSPIMPIMGDNEKLAQFKIRIAMTTRVITCDCNLNWSKYVQWLTESWIEGDYDTIYGLSREYPLR